jgi:hypothetical protein
VEYTHSRLAACLISMAFVVDTLTTCAFAQVAPPTKIELPLKLKVGDAYTMKVRKTTKRTRNATVIDDTELTTTVTVRVMAKSDNRFVLRSALTSFSNTAKVEPPDGPIKREVLSAMLTAFKNYPSIMEVDGSGTPLRLRDWPTASKKLADVTRLNLTPAFRKLVTTKQKDATPDQIEAIVKQQVDGTINTAILRHDAESAACLDTKQVLLGSVQNQAWQLGAIHQSSADVASPIGQGTISTNSKGGMTKFDRAGDSATITYETTFDSNALLKATVEMTRAQLAATGAKDADVKSTLDFMARMKVERRDTGQAVLSIATGLVRRLEHTERVVSTSEDGQLRQEQVETTLITITPVKPAAAKTDAQPGGKAHLAPTAEPPTKPARPQ